MATSHPPFQRVRVLVLPDNAVVLTSLQAREKLLTMLKESSFYSEAPVLAQVVNLPLYEEQILLFTKVILHKSNPLCTTSLTCCCQAKQPRRALEIIVGKFGDYSRAEYYCAQYNNEDDYDLTVSLFKGNLELTTKTAIIECHVN